MAGLDYTTLWEAFASGTGWETAGPATGTGTTSTAISPGEDTAAYQARMTDFYDRVIGPSFGYDYSDEEGIQGGFGTRFPAGQSFAPLDLNAFEEAEREFRLAIGDPYGSSGPFSWENISRMKTYEGEKLGEAYELLAGELYGKGGDLGGEYGSTYNLSMEKQGEEYGTGLSGVREGLTSLTAGVGLASGTSGAVLRSGSAEMQAEDILEEAHKKSIGLGSEYMEGKAGIEDDLGENLRGALKDYLKAIDTEKESWYQGILADISRVRQTEGYETTTSVLAQYDKEWDVSEWGGLEYQSEADIAALRADPECYDGNNQYICADKEIDYGADPEYQFRQDEICGIGEIYNEEEGICESIEGLTLNQYGQLLGTGVGFEELNGCMSPSACNYDPNAVRDDGSCQQPAHKCWDESIVCSESDCAVDDRPRDCNETPDGTASVDDCGVCSGGDTGLTPNSGCEQDCAGEWGGTAVEDECGVCGGDGAQVQCSDGSQVCEEYTCPDEFQYQQCPSGEMMGPDGYCVPEDEEQQCESGYVKTQSGDCILDPNIDWEQYCTERPSAPECNTGVRNCLARVRCPEGQTLNDYCICADDR